MTTFLIIFEQVPEDTTIYLFETDDYILINQIIRINGKYCSDVANTAQEDSFISSILTLPGIVKCETGSLIGGLTNVILILTGHLL